jgi:hypothetical protein
LMGGEAWHPQGMPLHFTDQIGLDRALLTQCSYYTLCKKNPGKPDFGILLL